MKTRLIYLLLIFFSLQFTLLAQTDRKITLDFQNEELPAALKKLEQASGYRILFTYDDIQKYAQYRCPINHPTAMYRKAAVLAVGGYLTEYFPEDYFLWLRMLKNGSKFYNIQESLLWFRYSEEAVARRGGWAYACDEVRVLVRMLKMGYIPFHVF